MAIHLRELELKDAPLMYEWMHDNDIQKCFQKKMNMYSIKEIESFCMNNNPLPDIICQGTTIHYAIANDIDEYLGTISLKNIDIINKRAEYAIALRNKAQGQGIAYEASCELIRLAFNDYNLTEIYLSCFSDNEKAIDLYKRLGFVKEHEERLVLDNTAKTLGWYNLFR